MQRQNSLVLVAMDTPGKYVKQVRSLLIKQRQQERISIELSNKITQFGFMYDNENNSNI